MRRALQYTTHELNTGNEQKRGWGNQVETNSKRCCGKSECTRCSQQFGEARKIKRTVNQHNKAFVEKLLPVLPQPAGAAASGRSWRRKCSRRPCARPPKTPPERRREERSEDKQNVKPNTKQREQDYGRNEVETCLMQPEMDAFLLATTWCAMVLPSSSREFTSTWSLQNKICKPRSCTHADKHRDRRRDRGPHPLIMVCAQRIWPLSTTHTQ